MKKDIEESCVYDNDNLPGSWDKMIDMAQSGKFSRIRIDTPSDSKFIDVIGCFQRSCKKKSGKCTIENDSIVVISKNAHPYACCVAVQLEPQQDNLIIPKNNQSVLWIPAKAGNRGGYDSVKAMVENCTQYTGTTVQIKVHILRDTTFDQTRIKSLKRKWCLELNREASHFQLSD